MGGLDKFKETAGNDSGLDVEGTLDFVEGNDGDIPIEVVEKLIETGREFYLTRSVTYSVGYMDVDGSETVEGEKETIRAVRPEKEPGDFVYPEPVDFVYPEQS